MSSGSRVSPHCFSFAAESPVWLLQEEADRWAVRWERFGTSAWRQDQGTRWRQKFPEAGRKAREPRGKRETGQGEGTGEHLSTPCLAGTPRA